MLKLRAALSATGYFCILSTQIKMLYTDGSAFLTYHNNNALSMIIVINAF